jgi:hypothetical protein
VSWFLGVAVVALILQVILLSGFIAKLAGTLPDQGPELAAESTRILTQAFLVSLLFLVPVTLGVGILITFRIAGPVYRFEEHLGSIARGEEVGPCRIRKGDQLQGLCVKINAAIEALRARQHAGEPSESEREAA